MTGRDHAGPSNRRQPARQARTNPSRMSTSVQAATAATTAPQEDSEPPTPGFYPAITHFTDSITALPKEMVRHFTMLKEVDAKIYAPEALLAQMFRSASAVPARFGDPSHHFVTDDSKIKALPDRTKFFKNMHAVLSTTMIPILDEKIHVMSTAIEALDKQLKRCQSSFPYIDDEISEEARLGSARHWAYTDKTSEKKGIIAGERTRRAANSALAHEGAEAAGRSEARRDAVAARKGRGHHLEAEFDDTRGGRKGHLGAKGRKLAETSLAVNGIGLGISNVNGPPSKRRKTEKNAPSSQPMERAIGSALGSNVGSARGGKEGPSTTSKKTKVAAVPNGLNKRRANASASGINSPAASSPVLGTFATSSKDRQGRSPAPAAMQRVPSVRARQSSLQNVMQNNRNRSSSTNQNQKNGDNAVNGQQLLLTDIEKTSVPSDRPAIEARNSAKDVVNTKSETLADAKDTTNGSRTIQPPSSRTNGDRNAKKEDPEAPATSRSRAERPASISTRGGGSKAPSANPTPHTATFGDQAKPRAPLRAADLPIKRSHKKGAGIAAQLAAQERLQRDGEDSSMQDEDDEDGENEPRYCYCNGVSYGEMVGCDADDCSREWFHLPCVGLSKAPSKNTKWYCDECKEKLKKPRINGGNGR